MKKELVRDWMTTDVITITPDMTLPEAHQLMTNEEIRRLPVVDKHGRRSASSASATCAAPSHRRLRR